MKTKMMLRAVPAAVMLAIAAVGTSSATGMSGMSGMGAWVVSHKSHQRSFGTADHDVVEMTPVDLAVFGW